MMEPRKKPSYLFPPSLSQGPALYQLLFARRADQAPFIAVDAADAAR